MFLYNIIFCLVSKVINIVPLLYITTNFVSCLSYILQSHIRSFNKSCFLFGCTKHILLKCTTTIHLLTFVHSISSIMSTNTHTYIISTRHTIFICQNRISYQQTTHCFALFTSNIHSCIILPTLHKFYPPQQFCAQGITITSNG